MYLPPFSPSLKRWGILKRIKRCYVSIPLEIWLHIFEVQTHIRIYLKNNFLWLPYPYLQNMDTFNKMRINQIFTILMLNHNWLSLMLQLNLFLYEHGQNLISTDGAKSWFNNLSPEFSFGKWCFSIKERK